MIMYTDLISIIVPIYNMELYLSKCIESIIKQSYDNIEILLVNDGSSDKSIEICKKYEKNDSRVRVINQKNCGVSSARNKGIDCSFGKYITFVDPDDYIEENMIERMYNVIEEKKADVVICGNKNIDENGKITNADIKNKELDMSGIDGLKGLLAEDIYNCVSWGKLYKKSVFSNNKFNCETKICEDLEVLYKIFYKCKKIVYIPDKLYVWLSRKDSVTKQKYNDLWRGEISICDKIVEFTRLNCPNITEYAIKRYIRVILSCFFIIEDNFDDNFRELRLKLRKYKLKEKKLLSVRKRLFMYMVVVMPHITKIILKRRKMIKD